MQQIKLALLPLASIQLAPWIVKARNGLERNIRLTSTRCSSACLVSSNLLCDLQACILYGRVLVGRKGELAGRLFPEKLCIFLWTGLGNGYGDEVSVFRARRPRRWWLDDDDENFISYIARLRVVLSVRAHRRRSYQREIARV
jgi:hypothetical protein